MAAKPRPPGETIDVARVVSVGRDRKTGEAVIRLRDESGRWVALRLRERQLRTLGRGVLGLVGLVESIDEPDAP